MKTIYINTTSNKEIVVGLYIDDQKFIKKHQLDFHKAQIVLPLIEKLLKEHKVDLHDIDEVEVNRGPGSFTGVRVGVSIANALGFALNIPVNGKKQLIEPRYT